MRANDGWGASFLCHSLKAAVFWTDSISIWCTESAQSISLCSNNFLDSATFAKTYMLDRFFIFNFACLIATSNVKVSVGKVICGSLATVQGLLHGSLWPMREGALKQISTSSFPSSFKRTDPKTLLFDWYFRSAYQNPSPFPVPRLNCPDDLVAAWSVEMWMLRFLELSSAMIRWFKVCHVHL